MPSAQITRPLPSFNVVLSADHYKTSLSNLSYPSRPHSHIPWSGSSAPLLFAKTTRHITTATSIPTIQIPTTANLDTCAVPDTFERIGMFIRRNLSMIVRTLKLIRQTLFGVSFTSVCATASV